MTMRVALVVPVALPCTPRGVWQWAGAARGRWAAARTGPSRRHTSYTSATRPVGTGTPECRNAVSKFATVRFGVVPFAASAIPAEIFADSDFNLGELRIRNSRGRVVSRPWPLNDGLGYRTGHASSRFTGSPAALAIHCAGHKAVFFFRFLT
jgi:hypothetical protein